jgi:hypothetical protein
MPESQIKKSFVDWEQLEAEMERPDQFVRIPGSFRYWEIGQVVNPHADYRVREDGATSDNTRLFSVYRRALESFDEDADTQLSLAGIGATPEGSPAMADACDLGATSRSTADDNGPIPYALTHEHAQAGPELVRLPGLYVGWDLQRLLAVGITPGTEYQLEPAGTRLGNGGDLFAIFQRTLREEKP